jgi:pyrrolidone-carboxylate peptidase
MHLATARRHAFRGGFLHVPCLPQQARGNTPSMAPEHIARGIAVVLEASARGAE